MVKCKQRARDVLFWPTMNASIENTVRNCCHCAEVPTRPSAESLQPLTVPNCFSSKWASICFSLSQSSTIGRLLFLSFFYQRRRTETVIDSLRCTSTEDAVLPVRHTRNITEQQWTTTLLQRIQVVSQLLSNSSYHMQHAQPAEQWCSGKRNPDSKKCGRKLWITTRRSWTTTLHR